VAIGDVYEALKSGLGEFNGF